MVCIRMHLWVKLLSQKYLRNHQFEDCPLKSSDSRFWKASLSSHIILKNQKWMIGNRSRVGICSDNWIPNLTHIDDDDQLYQSQSYIDPCRAVEDLTIKDGNVLNWNESLLRYIWCNEIVGEILHLGRAWTYIGPI